MSDWPTCYVPCSHCGQPTSCSDEIARARAEGVEQGRREGYEKGYLDSAEDCREARYIMGMAILQSDIYANADEQLRGAVDAAIRQQKEPDDG